MIFYFSATGNSKYVASRLAEATGEELVAMDDCLRRRRLVFRLREGERVRFVTPVYFWGLPSVVTDFVGKMDLQLCGRNFVYHVLTYGTTTGEAHWAMARLLRSRELTLDGRYIVRMVDTWTPMFDVSDKERCRRKTDAAVRAADKVVERVAAREAGDFDNRKLPHWLAHVYALTYALERRTSHFSLIGDRCVGCGLCARKCPVGAIEMSGGRPVWTKKQCVMCLGCLHRCPEFAIQRGCATRRHGQFTNPYTKL